MVKGMKTGPSRRLMICLAVLLMDSNSILNSTYPEVMISNSNRHNDKDIVWLVDEDDLCFGIYGFNTCSEMNAWTLKYINGENYYIEPYLDYNNLNYIDENDYLTISNQALKLSPQIKQGKHKLFEYNKWSYIISEGKLSIDVFDPIEMNMESYCIYNNHKTVELKNCNHKYTQLLAIHYPLEQKRLQEQQIEIISDSSTSSESILIKEGFWECPQTRLLFPRSINIGSSLTNQSTQILMGGGTYIKTVFNMNFKVYSMGWYVDADKVKIDPIFKPFQGYSHDELSSNPAFYDALIAESSYDRSMIIKLAMTLKCELIISGLVEELGMTPNNKVLLAEASRRYGQVDCVKGLELFFIWKRTNDFEVYVNNTLLAHIDEPTIGKDFFSQFVNNEPVSLDAKIGFTKNFPLLLNSDIKPNHDITSLETPTHSKRNLLQKGLNFVKKVSNKLFNRFNKNKSNSIKQFYSTSYESSTIDRPLWNKFYGKIYENINALHKLKKYIKNYIYSNNSKTSKHWFHRPKLSIHLSKNSQSWYIELFLSISLLFYFCLLIIISLPPALLSKGKNRLYRVVRAVKQTSLRRVENALRSTISTTTSLASLVRSKSSDSLYNSLVNLQRSNSVG